MADAPPADADAPPASAVTESAGDTSPSAPAAGTQTGADAKDRAGQTLVIRNQELAPGQPFAGQAPTSQQGTAIGVSFVEGKARPCKLVDSPAQ